MSQPPSMRRRAQRVAFAAFVLFLTSLVGLVFGISGAHVEASGITQVQEVGATETAQSTTLAATITSTAGDLLVVTATLRGVSTFAGTAVTDSASDTYSTVLTKASGTNVTGMFYAANAAAVTSVTVHASGTATMVATVQEFAGVSTSAPLDVDVGATASSTAPNSGTSATTTQAAEVVVASIGWNGTATISGPTSGYTTNAVHQSNVASLVDNEQSAYKVVSATGTQAYAATLSSTFVWSDILATFKSGSYASAILGNGPSFYYRLDESSGSTMADSSGNGRNGTYGSGFTYGIAGALSGDSDTAVEPNGHLVGTETATAGEPIGASAVTLEGWVRTTSTSQQTLLSYGGTGSGQSLSLMTSTAQTYGDGDFGVVTNGGSYWFTPSRPVDDGNWHLLDVTYNGSTVTGYMDGVAVGTAYTSVTLSTTAGSIDVGGLVWCSCDNVQGSTSGLDEVALYPSALTGTQVVNHFAASGDTVPTAPGSVAATSGANQATVTWTASSASVPSGETAVLGYVAIAYSGGTARNATSVASSATSATLTGLKGGTAYTFEVFAVNAFGFGAAGMSSSHTPTGGSTTYASTILGDSPAAYYRLDDSGPVIADSSGSANQALAGTGFTTGVGGSLSSDADAALEPNGHVVGSELSATGEPIGTSAVTVEGWVRTTSTSQQTLVSYGGTNTGQSLSLLTSNRQAYGDGDFGIVTNSASYWFTPPRPVDDGNWHLLDVTYDGSTVTGYMDGKSVGSAYSSVTLTTTAGPLVIGGLVFCSGCDSPQGTNSGLDEVAIYPSALTSTQILNHFTASGNTVPTAPGSVTAVVSGGTNQATVSWIASTATVPGTETAVQGYVVTAYVGSTARNSTSVASSATSATLKGLKGGTAYTFEVYGINPFGSGSVGTSSSHTPTGSATTYASTILGDGPDFYYRLDDSGPLISDSTGNTSLGVPQHALAGTGFVSGVSGAVSTDGDAAVEPNGGTIGTYLVGAGEPTGASPVTLEGWIRTTSGSSQTVVSYGGTGTGQSLSIVVSNSSVYGAGSFGIYTDATSYVWSPSHPVNDGTWHLLDVTYNGSTTATAYLDGQLVGSATISMLTTTQGPLVVGGLVYCGGCDQPQGTNSGLDDVAVYPTALSGTAIANHFAQSGHAQPGTPVFVHGAYGGSNAATVSWGVPGPRGVPLTYYLVQATGGGHVANAVYVPGTQTAARVAGLAAGVAYTFTVIASNAWGAGPTATSTNSFTPTGVSSTYASAVIGDGAGPYYRFSESRGLVFADSSSQVSEGHFDGSNGVTVDQAGAVGTDPAVMLSGSCCSATTLTTDPTSLPTGNSARSVEVWVKLATTSSCATTSYCEIVSWGPTVMTGVGQEFAVATSSSGLDVITGGNDVQFTYPGGTDIDGAWHYLVVTYNGTSVSAYLDGSSLGSPQSFTATPSTVNALGLELGYAPYYSGATLYVWSGGLDELAIYNSALTATQVSTHYSLRGH